MQRAFPLTFGKEVCLEPRALQLEPEEVPLRGSTNGDALGDQRISTGEQLQRVAQELLLATGFPELGEGTEDLLPKPAFIGVLLELNGAGFSGGLFPAQGVDGRPGKHLPQPEHQHPHWLGTERRTWGEVRYTEHEHGIGWCHPRHDALRSRLPACLQRGKGRILAECLVYPPLWFLGAEGVS